MNNTRTGPHKRLLIYAFPAILDMVVACLAFVNSVRAARMGVSASLVAGTLAAWSLVYTVACPIVGRFVRERNAAAFLLAGGLGMAVVCWVVPLWPGLAGIYAVAVLGAVASALFFPPFQVFMKTVDRAGGKSTTYSTGLYTFAWSLGFAAGPFVAGFLLDLQGTALPGYAYAYGLAGALALAVALGVRSLRRLEDGADNGAPAPAAAGHDYSRMPDLVWLGWIGAGAGILVICIIRALFPVRAVNVLHLSGRTQGMLFFLLSFAQALTALLLTRSRLWMYRPRAVAAFGAVGAIGCLGFGIGRHVGVLALAAVAFGIYAGSFFFYLVFHALVHPRRSAQYVAINESVVGLSGILGPLIGGVLADTRGSATPYAAGVAVAVAATAWQVFMHRRHPAPT